MMTWVLFWYGLWGGIVDLSLQETCALTQHKKDEA